MRIVTLDLRQLVSELGGVDSVYIDDVEGICECGGYVTQVMDECPVCHVRIGWRYSETWDWMYREWVHPLARYLFAKSNTTKFRTIKEYHTFKRITEQMSEDDIQETIDYCAKSASGRGLVKYALHALEAKRNKQAEPISIIDDRGVRRLD